MLAIIVLSSSPATAHNTKNHAGPIHLPPPDIADLLSVAGPFQTFLGYLQKTNVIQTFQNQANTTTAAGITIFVPKDSAFTALKKTTLARLTKNQLKSLLLYHALRRFYSLSQLGLPGRRSRLVATFAGSRYTLNLTDDIVGSIRVRSTWSNAKIRSSVYVTAPVAVYEVDKVLLPKQIFKSRPPLGLANSVRRS
ncbi:hypothetical protein U9M48_038357 [Paspalum notatum var. saurae]|uniref:FAS1 domain-containing protein n=1 Tax=Paspalum notatum var. saurae TaxID=547442 RepID=A0AAQ3UGZ6_PASNO